MYAACYIQFQNLACWKLYKLCWAALKHTWLSDLVGLQCERKVSAALMLWQLLPSLPFALGLYCLEYSEGGDWELCQYHNIISASILAHYWHRALLTPFDRFVQQLYGRKCLKEMSSNLILQSVLAAHKCTTWVCCKISSIADAFLLDLHHAIVQWWHCILCKCGGVNRIDNRISCKADLGY